MAKKELGNKKNSKKRIISIDKAKGDFTEYLLDHPVTKTIVSNIYIFFMLTLSAILFSYGYRAFIAPKVASHLISGGASGIAQVFVKIIQIFGYKENENLIQSSLYLAINIPLFFIAWKFIGKKFTITTIYNVVLTSVLIEVLPNEAVVIFQIDTDYIARALFAGILTGLSSGCAFSVGSSAGGIDIVAFAIAEKKSTSVGKYSLFINGVTVIIYTLLQCIYIGGLEEVKMALFTIIYFFTCAKVVDIVNIKNRKTELQITTSDENLPVLLLRTVPHGCTIVDAVGGYTGQPRKLIYMVVSMPEVKEVVELVRKLDKYAFVNVINSNQVYGRFYIKPLK